MGKWSSSQTIYVRSIKTLFKEWKKPLVTFQPIFKIQTNLLSINDSTFQSCPIYFFIAHDEKCVLFWNGEVKAEFHNLCVCHGENSAVYSLSFHSYWLVLFLLSSFFITVALVPGLVSAGAKAECCLLKLLPYNIAPQQCLDGGRRVKLIFFKNSSSLARWTSGLTESWSWRDSL